MKPEKYYDWQKEVIEHEGDCAIRGGRQDGKSIAVAAQIVYRALKYPKTISLITSPSERQENFIFEKVKDVLGEKYKYKKRATLKRLVLQNDSIIYKFPTGTHGVFIEGMSSVDFLYIDEAKGMNEVAFHSILPMLAEPKNRGKGWVTMLSNTRGKIGATFRNAFKEGSGYRTWHIKSEDCPHISKEFLKKERERLGEMLYSQIWQGEFVDFEYNYFRKEIIDKFFCLKSWTFNENFNKSKKYVIGCDPARYGKAVAGIIIGEFNGKDRIDIIHIISIEKCSMVDLYKELVYLHLKFNNAQIYIDTGGVGAGLYDFLIKKFKNKIIDLNNASRGETRGNILKEDLYSNLLRMMEEEKVKSVNNEKLRESLESIEFEGEKITGKKTDLVEALARCCYAVKLAKHEPKIV